MQVRWVTLSVLLEKQRTEDECVAASLFARTKAYIYKCVCPRRWRSRRGKVGQVNKTDPARAHLNKRRRRAAHTISKQRKTRWLSAEMPRRVFSISLRFHPNQINLQLVLPGLTLVLDNVSFSTPVHLESRCTARGEMPKMSSEKFLCENSFGLADSFNEKGWNYSRRRRWINRVCGTAGILITADICLSGTTQSEIQYYQSLHTWLNCAR